jgi:hypothetical protein
MISSICNALLQSFVDALHHPIKNFLTNFANVLVHPDLQLFNILQSIKNHFLF